MAATSRTIRVGVVSSINAKAGTVRVTYPDLDDSVTAELPVLSFADTYKMPPVGAEVVVAHLSNGEAAGVVLGRYWSEDHAPAKYGKKVFRIELGQNPGDAYIQCENGVVTIHASQIKLDGSVDCPNPHL